ncbi:RNA-binding protein 39 [Pelomyxa schiedti]|nr:RNA-binding protein 39 [Pelomyxa schiedti]
MKRRPTRPATISGEEEVEDGADSGVATAPTTKKSRVDTAAPSGKSKKKAARPKPLVTSVPEADDDDGDDSSDITIATATKRELCVASSSTENAKSAAKKGATAAVSKSAKNEEEEEEEQAEQEEQEEQEEEQAEEQAEPEEQEQVLSLKPARDSKTAAATSTSTAASATSKSARSAQPEKSATKPGGSTTTSPPAAPAQLGGLPLHQGSLSGSLVQSSTKVFVGNLSLKVQPEDLEKMFSSCGPNAGIQFITDKKTGKFYGTAFVHFTNSQSARRAVSLNGQKLQGRPIKIELAREVPIPKSSPIPGAVTVFVGCLPANITDAMIKKVFSPFGEIKDVRFCHDPEGTFKGCGFIEFVNEVGAAAAVSCTPPPSIPGTNIPIPVKYAHRESKAKKF